MIQHKDKPATFFFFWARNGFTDSRIWATLFDLFYKFLISQPGCDGFTEQSWRGKPPPLDFDLEAQREYNKRLVALVVDDSELPQVDDRVRWDFRPNRLLTNRDISAGIEIFFYLDDLPVGTLKYYPLTDKLVYSVDSIQASDLSLLNFAIPEAVQEAKQLMTMYVGMGRQLEGG